MTPRFNLFAAAGACSAVIALTTGIAVAQSLPAGNGKDVVEKICSGCHELDSITGGGGGTREEWEQTVKDMIGMGAEIKPEEAALITTYLANSFPPKTKR